MDLQKRLSEILSLNLAKDYTAVSYAIMIDGKLWAADALGHDGTQENLPVTTNHTFNVCSISKIFCTTAVMQLVEQGKLDLDTPVCIYLPRFKMLDERYQDITLRHCLNHSSGLPGTQWKHFSATHVGDPNNEAYYEEVYDYLAKCHLKAAPGTYSVYCNDGFTLAEMVVAAVSGIPFGAYCRQYITEPIGAHSTRPSTVHNSQYPLVREKGKVPEYFYLQGCGGFTTTMIDLCKFGQLFLTDNDIISEESKALMRLPQGVTFLPDDTSSPCYGLGWDNVHVNEPEFDLGDHVQKKGGNSFQFTSALYVIPKYHAVLAISETHDCRIDVNEAILNMFATAMLEERNINIFRKYQPVPAQMAEKFGGTYLVPGRILNTHFFGTHLTLTNDDTHGGHSAEFKDLKFDGEKFIGDNGEQYFFKTYEDDTYFYATYHGRVAPTAMKAKAYPSLSKKWQQRIGKKYVAVDLTEQDMVSHEMMTGFTAASLPGYEGIFVASFSAIPDGDIYGRFEGCAVPVDDDTARGFLNTPSNGSRDLIDPYFVVKDGIEYCYVATYLYKDQEALPVYKGEGFENGLYSKQYNSVYKLGEMLSTIPTVPEGHRLIVMDDEMSVVYDSQVKKEFKPVKSGFISLI